MLLPSALPCDSARSRFQTSLFPATSPPTSDDTLFANNGLTRACRALQTFATPPPSSVRRSKPRLLSPFEPRPLSPATKPNKVTKAPRGENKRRRHQCQYESEDDDDDEECSPSWIRERDPYKTPKRLCRVPPNMPMRMKVQDFEALETPRETKPAARPTRTERRRVPRRVPMPYKSIPQPVAEINLEPSQSSSDTSTEEWTSDDDDRLVNLVLEKLSLTKKEWNECAQAMGKDCDSIGRRWNMLVGEGHIGMRRGGRMTRPKIHESWR